jgi:hypothetical protein
MSLVTSLISNDEIVRVFTLKERMKWEKSK